MDTSIIPRELLSEQARAAVRESAEKGEAPANPYPLGSDAAKHFACYVKRWQTADVEGEASA